MTIFPLLESAVIAIIFFSLGGFTLSRILERNDVADVLWGVGIFVVALVGYLSTPTPSVLLSFLIVVVGIWACRLSGRIFLRNVQKTEDKRYRALSASWGKWFFLRSYLQVFLLQSLLMVVVGYPVLHAAAFNGASVTLPLVALGFIVWMVGFLFETIADSQLDQFLKDPANRGTVLSSGLWRYSRHPNYFGEVTQWWGIFLMVLTLPYGFVAIVSPLLITFLILKVSGIPMLEKAFEGNPAFAAYKEKTSPFFPLPPKR